MKNKQPFTMIGEQVEVPESLNITVEIFGEPVTFTRHGAQYFRMLDILYGREEAILMTEAEVSGVEIETLRKTKGLYGKKEQPEKKTKQTRRGPGQGPSGAFR